MSTIYTEDVSGDYKKLSDDDRDIEKRIEELRAAIQEFKQELVDEEVEKHLKLMVEDGLVTKEKNGYAPVFKGRKFTGR